MAGNNKNRDLIAVIIAIGLIILGGSLFTVYENMRVKERIDIERSTVLREALPEDKCVKYDKWYQDDTREIRVGSDEEKEIVEGLQHFYEKTGVQPYLWIVETPESSRDRDPDSLQELADCKYEELFGDDNGHMVVAFWIYLSSCKYSIPEVSSRYTVALSVGSDAESQVIDAQAKTIMKDFIAFHSVELCGKDGSESKFILNSFVDSSDRIMTKQLRWYQIGVIIVSVVIAIIIVAVVLIRVVTVSINRKVKDAQELAEKSSDKADKMFSDFHAKQYLDDLEKNYFAVSCPNCGSSANKIRKGSANRCPFCGARIRVDNNGNVKTY